MFGQITQTENYGFDKLEQETLNNLIDDYDKNLLQIIADLYKSMNGEDIDIDGAMNAIDALMKFNKKSKHNYLNDLLYPEIYKNVKIPSPIPVPSCSFQLHNTISLKANHYGNLAIMFNPFFLASNVHITDLNNAIVDQDINYGFLVNKYSTFYANAAGNLNGFSENKKWGMYDIGQEIPPVYNQYRLVSASIVAKYIGRLDIASGVIGGAIIFQDSNELGSKGTVYDMQNQQELGDYNSVPKFLWKYGNFDLAMDSHYHQQNYILDGIRLLYFPIDNSYEEYTKIYSDRISGGMKFDVNDDGSNPVYTYCNKDNVKNGFNFFIYTLGAPTLEKIKIDIYCNFECLPESEFLDYMPTTTADYTITNNEKKQVIETVQKKPITSLKDTAGNLLTKIKSWKDNIVGIYNKIKSNKVLNTIGTIIKAIAKGILFLKTGKI